MSRKRSKEAIAKLKQQFMEGCLGNGVSQQVAEAVFRKIAGFAEFGFPTPLPSACWPTRRPGYAPTTQRRLLWQLGLLYRSEGRNGHDRQLALPLPTEQDMVALPAMTDWDRMAADYANPGTVAEPP